MSNLTLPPLERHRCGAADHRRQVVAAVENWWDRYRVTARAIEAERAAAAARLAGCWRELGCVS